MTTRTSVTKRRAGAGQLVPADDEPLRQEIALRAYYRYCDRGRIFGFEIEDWLAAEREVLAARAKTPVDQSEGAPSGRRAGRRSKRQPAR
jgi:hypothetical protein